MFYLYITGAPSETRGRQTVQVRGVPEAVQPQDGLATSHVLTHGRKTLYVRTLRKGIHPRGQDDQALRYTQKETKFAHSLKMK